MSPGELLQTTKLQRLHVAFLLSFTVRFCQLYQEASSQKLYSQIQPDNLVQEAQEAQVAQLVPWVQADQPVRALLQVPVNQSLLELPVGWNDRSKISVQNK